MVGQALQVNAMSPSSSEKRRCSEAAGMEVFFRRVFWHTWPLGNPMHMVGTKYASRADSVSDSVCDFLDNQSGSLARACFHMFPCRLRLLKELFTRRRSTVYSHPVLQKLQELHIFIAISSTMSENHVRHLQPAGWARHVSPEHVQTFPMLLLNQAAATMTKSSFAWSSSASAVLSCYKYFQQPISWVLE